MTTWCTKIMILIRLSLKKRNLFLLNPAKVSEIKFGEFEPSENSKAPACKKVTVILTIEHGKYDYFIKKDFLIYSKMNWLIRDFFICIGIGTKDNESKNGKVYINIDKFLEPDPIPF